MRSCENRRTVSEPADRDAAASTPKRPRLDAPETLVTGGAIIGAGGVLGLIVGAGAAGSAGLWAFVGLGAGVVVATLVLSVKVIRGL
jgi:hypothetical protein